jgi:hypothetical protein
VHDLKGQCGVAQAEQERRTQGTFAIMTASRAGARMWLRRLGFRGDPMHTGVPSMSPSALPMLGSTLAPGLNALARPPRGPLPHKVPGVRFSVIAENFHDSLHLSN